jgi:TRAP-type mannitol/chloroaromatic compound transport system substrate-binding protein
VERRSFLKKASLGVVAGAAAAPALAQTQPTLQWRMASSFPKTLDTLFGTAEFIAKRVSDLTDGRFQIRVFAAGEIVPPLAVLDKVQDGTIECGHTASYYYVGKDPAFAFGTAIPFGLNSRQMSAWMYSGGGQEALEPLFREFGCMHFPAGNTGTQMGGWFRKEIRTLADIKGLKFRIAGLAGQVFAKLGAVPTQIAGGEIYQGLERGTIDAAEWVGPYDDEKLGLAKVAKYYYYPGFWEGSAQLCALVNQKAWAALPKSYQAAFEAASAEAHSHMQARYDASNTNALRRLLAGGAQLRGFSRPVLEAAEKAAFEIYDELGAKSAHWKRIYPEWKKFRDDQYAWFRVAEQSFDRFSYDQFGAARGDGAKGPAKAPAKK